MKQRITGLDLQILTAELSKEILNYRLQNIYNVSSSSRQFLLKFSIPDSKKVIVLDCGNKLHLTEFERPTTQTPSNFVTKLRKHLKTRRLSQIKQIGNDRILVLEFSDGLFYLVLEFFSAGNILLLDEDKKILSLQRMVNDKGGNDRYAVNEIYKMFDKDMLKTDFKYERQSYSVEQIQGWIQSQREKLEQKVQETSTKKKAKIYSIHKLLFVNCSHLSSDLVQINLIKNGILSSTSCFEFDNDSNLELVVQALENAEEEYINLLEKSKESISGYIVSKKNRSYDPDNHDSTNDLEYIMDEFYPYKPYKADEQNYKFTKVDGYNKTLDSFFSTIESTKYALRIDQQKQQAHKRLDHARQERDKQIQSLVAQQELNIKKGDTIMYYADLVDLCKESVVKLIDQQMDWTNIESLIELEQSRGNKIAKLINLPLNLKENKINLHLPDMDEQNEESPDSSNSDSDSDLDSDSDSDSSSSELENESDTDSEREMANTKNAKKKKKTKSTVSVWIDISLSSFANARLYFESKKSAESKQIKVEKNTEFALKNAQRKIEQDLKNKLKSENETLKQIRPKYWFEKFFWFVSSEGYLCLAGRDNSQTDMIYYRHFNDNDHFVSSDIEGSLKVFIKNPFKGESIPPSTLMQAGIFAISSSSAWNGKVTTSAWVLHGTDISKKDFDGTLISPGNFNYKSKKSYLPPCQLVMGFGFYWLGDEETSTKYRNARLLKEQEHGLKIVMDNKKQDLEHDSKLQEIVQPDISTSTVGQDANDDKDSKDMQVSNSDQDANDADEKSGAESESSNKDTSPETFSDSKDGKRRLSAKERRMLRKGKVGKVVSDENEFDPIAEQLKNMKIEEAKNKASESSQKPPNVRGKKAKMKKIATKYADQDEEERRIRMEALGTLKQIEAEKQKEADDQRKNDLKTKYTNEALNAERRRNQEEREYRKYIMEEANEDESSATNYLEILDSFICKPHPDDSLTNLVPVFAPWSSLSKFKYKVKIQPGSGKKGKCINDTLNYFANRKMDPSHTDLDLDWENERELLKNSKPNDLVGAFTVSKVKLMLPGGQEKALKKPAGKKGKK